MSDSRLLPIPSQNRRRVNRRHSSRRRGTAAATDRLLALAVEQRKNASSADRMKDVKSRALPIRPASKIKNVRQASRSLQQGKSMIVAGFADSGSSQVFWLLKESEANKYGTRGDNKVVLKAHPYALLDASLALQNEYTLSTTMVLIQQPYTPFPSQVQATGRDEALKTPSVHTVLSICQEESDVSSLLDKTTPSQRGVQAAKPTRQKTPHNEIKV
ncbi:hypothetical protein F2Q69_00041058 [Brassica cretica]|uniref:Uncharacterized protein n=1 Tax=Brassica cretica TaxID=69181 RepID=A0A8S9NI17_BRACR|nr:hypothetical protein F2Q69_00041058 [Brassica cretica]